MSEAGDEMREYREAQQERRIKRLPIRTQEILDLKKMGHVIKRLTDYQYRVDGVVDLYPIHHRVHWLRKNQWGEYRPFYLAQQIEKILRK